MESETGSLPPILTAHLFMPLDACLIELLELLTDAQWERETIAGEWKVKDVAAHLLDTAVRRLSMGRDGYISESPEIQSNQDLVNFINGMNQQGVRFFRRLSRSVLISMMKPVIAELSEYFLRLDPFSFATFAVSWAGEQRSLNWFDVAREYTERWHHQQQIRIAVNSPGILIRELYYPVLDCFMRALPHTYSKLEVPSETYLRINVSGKSGGAWFLYRDSASWRLVPSPVGNLIAEITIPEEIAWLIFTKGINRSSAKAAIEFTGDPVVALHILNAIAIVG